MFQIAIDYKVQCLLHLAGFVVDVETARTLRKWGSVVFHMLVQHSFITSLIQEPKM